MNKFDKFYNENINEDIESDLYAHKDRYNKGLTTHTKSHTVRLHHETK